MNYPITVAVLVPIILVIIREDAYEEASKQKCSCSAATGK
jgi:hypothetical protein